MRAAVITGPRTVVVRQVAVPEPGPGEVLIQLEGCGLCSADLAAWQGRPWLEYPLPAGAPGHEGWGMVAAVGAGVTQVEVGDRVAAICRRGLAEYDLARQDELVPLPASLGALDMPGESLGSVMNIWRRSAIRQEHCVAVVGVGFTGALLIQLAHRVGAHVVAISRRPGSLGLARALGAATTFVLDGDGAAQGPSTSPLGAASTGGDAGVGALGGDDRIVAAIEDLTRGRGCDRVIETAGTQRTLDLATRITRTRGRIIIAGLHQDGPRVVDMHEWSWRGLDVVNAHERDPRVHVEGMRAALDALESGALDPMPLISHRLELGRLGQAFALLEDRPDEFVKAEIILQG